MRGPNAAARAPKLVVTPGDLDDRDAVNALIEGADLVVHVAGCIKARNPAQFMAVNRDATAALARASLGRAPMLLVSSQVAREPALSAYAASKAAGEAAARAILGEALTIARPPAVYGPGDRETLSLFQTLARAPIAPCLGGPDARLALVHVEDAARGLLYLATARGAGPYVLPGDRPEGYSWREMIAAAAAAVGRAPPVVQAPGLLVHAAGALSDLTAPLRRETAIFGRGKAREIRHADWSVHADELAAGLPPARWTLAEGFADTVRWYRREGWL